MVLLPLLAGLVAVDLATRVLTRPNNTGAVVVWTSFLIILSTIVAILVQRITRRLAPLAALFKLSLAFPDEAPSRFRVAIRKNSGRSLARQIEQADESITDQQAAERMVVLLAELGAHDRLTRGHSERVRAFSVMLGEEIGLPEEDLAKLNWAALIHDIGKLQVDEAILNKPGRPTEQEWIALRAHPGASASYVEPLRPWLGDWVDAATQHHERYDGGGYPGGLRGDQISLAGRIVAIADAFDVMTAARSYKSPLPPEQARAELLQNAGTQFDAGLVRAFMQISIGRMRWFIGPAGWLAHFPDLVRAPIQAVAATSATAVVAATVAVAAAASVAVPVANPIEAATPPGVERVLPTVEDPLALVAVEDAVAEDTSPAEATTTTEPAEAVATSPIAAPTSTVPAATSITTTLPPGTTATTSPTTTALPSPSTTSLPSSTTTNAPLMGTTTTTSTTTTTTAPPVVTLSMYPGSSGGVKLTYLPLDGSLAAGSLADYDGDGNPGLLVLKGDGLDEVSDDKMQRWFDNAGGAVTISGTPQLSIWAATKDFDTDKSAALDVGIYECAANKTDCNLLANGSASFDQSTFGNDFGFVTITTGPVNTTIAPSRGLMLKVAPNDDSEDHVWLAFANVNYPTIFTIS